MSHWHNFKGGKWQETIDVRDFINQNYEEYLGDSNFLEGPTKDSASLNVEFIKLIKAEKDNGGTIDMDTNVVSSITSHGAGYINKDLETIVGLQTDAPFKRAFHPYGGIKVAVQAASAYGYEIN